jgi:hypothetical protein
MKLFCFRRQEIVIFAATWQTGDFQLFSEAIERKPDMDKGVIPSS